jgi:hypothetical protein
MSGVDSNEQFKSAEKGFDSSEHVENIAQAHVDEITALSSIEAAAASKAAWLISVTVSLGGLLFGMSPCILVPSVVANDIPAQVTTPATSLLFLSPLELR